MVAGGCAVANLVIGARHFLQVPRLSDFMLFYAAATVARQHGWSHLYDLGLQAATEAALDPQGYFLPFYYPPPVAVLALPFSYLPLIAGYIAWVLLLLVVLVITWWLAAPGVGAAKFLQIVLAVGLFPLAFGVREGQLVMVVGLGMAIAWRAERAGHPVWAGAALSLLALKPQLAFLVPVALLVAGRHRVLAGLAIAGGLLAAASLLMIGGDGVRGWMAAIQAASRVHQEAYSLRGWLGTSAWVLPLEAAAAALALVAAWRHRHSFALVLGAAVVGSLLATPYLHLQDLSLLVPAAWLAWSAEPSGSLRRFTTAGWLALNLALVSGVAAVLVEAAWISWLAAVPSPRCRCRPARR